MPFNFTKIRNPRKPTPAKEPASNRCGADNQSLSTPAIEDAPARKPNGMRPELKVQTWEIHGAF